MTGLRAVHIKITDTPLTEIVSTGASGSSTLNLAIKKNPESVRGQHQCWFLLLGKKENGKVLFRSRLMQKQD